MWMMMLGGNFRDFCKMALEKYEVSANSCRGHFKGYSGKKPHFQMDERIEKATAMEKRMDMAVDRVFMEKKGLMLANTMLDQALRGEIKLTVKEAQLILRNALSSQDSRKAHSLMERKLNQGQALINKMFHASLYGDDEVIEGEIIDDTSRSIQQIAEAGPEGVLEQDKEGEAGRSLLHRGISGPPSSSGPEELDKELNTGDKHSDPGEQVG